MISPDVTVTATPPRDQPALPKLPPHQFKDCYDRNRFSGPDTMDYTGIAICEIELRRDQRLVADKCANRDGGNAPAVIIQACNELLNSKVLEGRDRFALFVNRAVAYFAAGDRPHALDDYNAAVTLSPKEAQAYYYRGVFYAQTDPDAALRDFDAALGFKPHFTAALVQRAKLRKVRGDLGGALADYSEAIRLQPKMAAAWSDRGYVRLLQRDFTSALKDEAEAIRLDPKLARAWYLRGAAYGDLGDSANAVSDVRTAVGIDPSLDRYIWTKDKTTTLTLPPL
jgi:tetratricopeptide (TPR) repeat protein